MIRKFGPVLATLALMLGGGQSVATAAVGAADETRFNERAALEVSQAAVGHRLGDYIFRDTKGQPFPLAKLLGRPIVVNLVYTACTYYCPLTVQSLDRGVRSAQDSLGADSFTVLTIGFDSRNDNPARMQAYARAQGVNLPNWYFLSADAETILALTADLGFAFYPSSQGFDHLAQTTVIAPDGTVYAQLYGSDLSVPTVVEPLKSLRYGLARSSVSIDSIIERVKLFCTLYDPNSDIYRFDWSIFTGMAIGALSVGGLAAFFISALLQRRRIDRSA